MNLEDWKRTVRDPARNATEGIRSLEAGPVRAEYEIARLPEGDYAIRLLFSSPQTGAAIPWRSYETREACIEVFLEQARRWITPGQGISESQNAFRRALLERLTSGLFGFEEPDPSPPSH